MTKLEKKRLNESLKNIIAVKEDGEYFSSSQIFDRGAYHEGWVEGQAELAKFIIEVFENED